MVRTALTDDAPSRSPRITRREAVGRARRRIRLHFDEGEPIELAPAVLEQFLLHDDDPVDPALRARLLDADLRHRCREAALSLLDVRARSRQELAQRLRRKEFPAAIVRETLDDFVDRGWLDDAAFARSLTRDRIRFKPRAPVRVKQELQRRGVDRDIADAEVQRVLDEEETSVEDLAREAAEGWVRRQGLGVQQDLARREWSESTEKAKRRLMGYLARRGFGGSIAVSALDAARTSARGLVRAASESL